MNDWAPIVLALIVSVIAPLVLAWAQNRARREEKKLDWAREDQVRITLAESNKAMSNQLTVIHTLVNSNMTAAMQDSLDSTVRELASLRELCELKRASGHEPSQDTLSAIAMAEAKIAELTAMLADRK